MSRAWISSGVVALAWACGASATTRPAPVAHHAPTVDPCSVAQRATDEAIASLRTTMESRADAAVVRALLDALVPSPADCHPTGGGAWALVVESAELGAEGLPSISLSLRAAFVDATGAIHRGEDALYASRFVDVEQVDDSVEDLGTDDPGAYSDASLSTAFDYDGDGTTEVFVQSQSAHYASHDVTLALLAFDGASVVTYAPAASIAIGHDEDVDHDTRPDIVSDTQFWSAEDGCGAGVPTVGAPPVLFHSRPDGTFSASDEVAARWLRERCPSAPTALLDPDWECDAVTTVQHIACARLWGASAESITARLEAERAALAADARASLDDDWATVRGIAAIEPPLTLRADDRAAR